MQPRTREPYHQRRGCVKRSVVVLRCFCSVMPLGEAELEFGLTMIVDTSDAWRGIFHVHGEVPWPTSSVASHALPSRDKITPRVMSDCNRCNLGSGFFLGYLRISPWASRVSASLGHAAPDLSSEETSSRTVVDVCK